MHCCDELANCIAWLNRVKTGRKLISSTTSLPVSITWVHVPGQDMFARYEPKSQTILLSGSARDYLTGTRLLARELQLSRHHLQLGTINPHDSLGTYTTRRIIANLDAEAVAATISVELAWKGNYQAVFRAMKSPEVSDIYRKVEPFCWKTFARRIDVYKTAVNAFLAHPRRVRNVVRESRDDWNEYDTARTAGLERPVSVSTNTARSQPLLDTYQDWISRVVAERPDLQAVRPLSVHGHER